jgi:hypothetical protein
MGGFQAKGAAVARSDISGPEFIIVEGADILRWTDTIWGRRRGLTIGTREVIAVLLPRPDSNKTVKLSVLACKATVEQVGAGSGMLKNGEAIKRPLLALFYGKVERLQWSDESARSIVMSRSRFPFPRGAINTHVAHLRPFPLCPHKLSGVATIL